MKNYLLIRICCNKIPLWQVSTASCGGQAISDGRKEGHFILEAPVLDVTIQSRAGIVPRG